MQPHASALPLGTNIHWWSMDSNSAGTSSIHSMLHGLYTQAHAWSMQRVTVGKSQQGGGKAIRITSAPETLVQRFKAGGAAALARRRGAVPAQGPLSPAGQRRR